MMSEFTRRRRQRTTEVSVETKAKKKMEIDPEVLRIEGVIQGYKDRIKNPLTAIRSMCVECMGGAVESIGPCATKTCSLYLFRMGKNVMSQRYGKPNPNAPTRRK